MTDIRVFLLDQARRVLADEAERVWAFEDTDSVRSPGWYRAVCHLEPGDASWETSGSQASVEESVRTHVAEKHPAGRLARAVMAAVGLHGAGMVDEQLAPWSPLLPTGRPPYCLHCSSLTGIPPVSMPCQALLVMARLFPDEPGFDPAWKA